RGAVRTAVLPLGVGPWLPAGGGGGQPFDLPGRVAAPGRLGTVVGLGCVRGLGPGVRRGRGGEFAHRGEDHPRAIVIMGVGNLPQQKTQFSPGGWALGRILSIVGVGQPAAGLWATDTLPGSASSRTGPFVVARCLGPELTRAGPPGVASPRVTTGPARG